jgi:hypothetical protein
MLFSVTLYGAFGKSLYLRLRYSAVYCDRPHVLNELKTAVTAYIRNILQADLQKVLANKIKRVQACIDTRGHHFQHSEFPNALNIHSVFF